MRAVNTRVNVVAKKQIDNAQKTTKSRNSEQKMLNNVAFVAIDISTVSHKTRDTC